jgi:diguanylate cyclase (GGDEF)-like protein
MRHAPSLRIPARLPRLALSVCGIVAIGAIDHATGTEIRVYPLYFVPLCTGSAHAGRWARALLVTLCALMWAASNYVAGLRFSHASIWALNVGTQLAAFATVSSLMSRVSQLLAVERRLSRADSLTGLLNSRAFYERAQLEFDRARRTESPLTLAYVDLDNFKVLNDWAGHAAGDRALAQFGELLRKHLRSTDVAARIGGDEFAVLLPDTAVDSASTVLQRLHASYAEALSDLPVSVTPSIGAVTFAAPPSSVDTAVRLADAVMYEVKRSGKNAAMLVHHPAGAPAEGARRVVISR